MRRVDRFQKGQGRTDGKEMGMKQTAMEQEEKKNQKSSGSWQQNIRMVDPYVPGEQPKIPGMIKLNTNECPYPPSPAVTEAAKVLECQDLRLYPDTDSKTLTNSLAEYYGLAPDQIFVGVGSDDVLAMAFLAFFHSDVPILFPDITYSFYDVWAELYRIPYQRCPLDENFRMVATDYMQPNGGIIFPNPNAPTGVLETLETIEAIVQANPAVIVIVDEAYIDFGGKSCLPLIQKYDNLLVVHTFSKSRAMAGCRIGYAMGSKQLIQYLNDVKFSFNSYTMNLPAQVLGTAAVQDAAYFDTITANIKATRERTKEALTRLGFTFPDAMGNFIFATHATVPAKEIYEALKEQKIFVRYWDKPRIDNYLRITIGTEEEMNQVITFLESYLPSRN